jgi:hypothetical protein
MAIKVGVLNGGINLNHDFHFQAIPTAAVKQGVWKDYLDELEVQTNLVKKGRSFITATRTSVSPTEEFLCVVDVTADETVDTSGDGYIVLKLDPAKVNDGSNNNATGTNIATVEKVAVLPSSNYIELASLASSVITDSRVFCELNTEILPPTYFYGEDAGSTDDYAVSIAGIKEYTDGMRVDFKANTVNTGPATLNINSLGAKKILKNNGVLLEDGDIAENQVVNVVYNSDLDSSSGAFSFVGQVASIPPEGITYPDFVAGEDVEKGKALSVFDDGKVYKSAIFTDSRATERSKFDCVARATTSKDVELEVDIIGYSDSLTGMTVNEKQYLGVADDSVVLSEFAGSTNVIVNFGRLTTYQKGGQTFNWASPYPVYASTLEVRLGKVGSPTDNIVCKIYESDKTTLVATATNVIAGTGGLGLSTFNFSPQLVFDANTEYFFELSRDGALSDTAYYTMQGTTAGGYTGGEAFRYNGSVWAAATGDAHFDFNATGVASIQPYSGSALTQDYGVDTSYVRLGQTFLVPDVEDVRLSSVIGIQRNTPEPSDNIVVNIYESDKTTLVASAQRTGAGCVYATPIYFDGEILQKNTTYFIEFTRDGGLSTPYYNMRFTSTSTYADGSMWGHNGTSWSELGSGAYDLNFTLAFNSTDSFGVITPDSTSNYLVGTAKSATEMVFDSGTLPVIGTTTLTNTQSLTVAHKRSKVPKTIKITASNTSSLENGIYDGTSQYCITDTTAYSDRILQSNSGAYWIASWDENNVYLTVQSSGTGNTVSLFYEIQF